MTLDLRALPAAALPAAQLLVLSASVLFGGTAPAAEPARPPDRGGIFIPFPGSKKDEEKPAPAPPAQSPAADEAAPPERSAETSAVAEPASSTAAAAAPSSQAATGQPASAVTEMPDASIDTAAARALRALLAVDPALADATLRAAAATLAARLPRVELDATVDLHTSVGGRKSGKLAAGQSATVIARHDGWREVFIPADARHGWLPPEARPTARQLP